MKADDGSPGGWRGARKHEAVPHNSRALQTKTTTTTENLDAVDLKEQAGQPFFSATTTRSSPQVIFPFRIETPLPRSTKRGKRKRPLQLDQIQRIHTDIFGNPANPRAPRRGPDPMGNLPPSGRHSTSFQCPLAWHNRILYTVRQSAYRRFRTHLGPSGDSGQSESPTRIRIPKAFMCLPINHLRNPP